MSDRLSDSQAREDSLASYAALRELRTSGHRAQPAAPVEASRAIVADADTTTLTLYSEAGALTSIVLGPSDAVRLASNLLLSARRRLGRPQPIEAE